MRDIRAPLKTDINRIQQESLITAPGFSVVSISNRISNFKIKKTNLNIFLQFPFRLCFI